VYVCVCVCIFGNDTQFIFIEFSISPRLIYKNLIVFTYFTLRRNWSWVQCTITI